MPLHYHDFITPKSSGNAAIGKAVALGFFFLLVALGDDFFAQANTVGLEVEERAFRYGENLHRTHVTFRQAGIDLIAHIVQGVAIFELDVQVRFLSKFLSLNQLKPVFRTLFALRCGDPLAVFINIFEWFIPDFIK